MSCMHALTFTHKSVSRKNTPNSGERDLGKVERWCEGSVGRARGTGPVYSPDNALKVTYGNVGGQQIFSPAAGFRLCLKNFSLQ